MDLSKLPRLSKTPPAPPSPAPSELPDPPAPEPQATAATFPCPVCQAPLRTGARFCDRCGAQLAAAAMMPGDSGLFIAEAWISLGIAALLFYLSWNLFRYLLPPHDTSGFDATVGETVIPYAHSAFIWEDLGVALFAAVLVIEAIVLLFFARKRFLLRTAFALHLAAMAFNAYVILHVYPLINGPPIICVLAFVFAGYGVFYWYSILRSMPDTNRA